VDAAARQLRHYEEKLAFEIDSWDLAAVLGAGERVLVVDARSTEAFRREHIPGALPLPHRAIDENTTAELDRGALLVAYCDGIGCNASTKGALALARLGFRVKELIGGLDWWKRDGHPTHAQTDEVDARGARGERSHQAAAEPACGC
jgi:rhodanese-related sulfurtransferase